MLCVRKADISEIPAVMQFISRHWKTDHILAVDRDFFEWMYVRDGELNFNIAIDDETGEMFGINGFILFNREKNPDIAGSMWKVIKSNNPALGLTLGEFSWQRWHPRDLFAIGMNERAARIEQLYGSEVSSLECWYRLGQRKEYRLAGIVTMPENEVEIKHGKFYEVTTLEEFRHAITEEQLRKNTPYKDYDYINHRYFEHPIYCYQMYLVKSEKEEYCGVFVCREVEHEGDRICKIVDYYGDDIAVAYSGKLWDGLLKKRKYEFIDFYCYGIRHEYLQQAGFSLLTEESGNIIPNYFEPFERENVRIRIVVSQWPSFHMYRGDGDQDRPSFLRI